MSERTKLLKKAVLTSVGASTNVDRIKDALQAAMDDLVKVGQDLLEDLEEKGKVKADSVQNFIKNLQADAGKKTGEFEKKVSSKVQVNIKKAVKDVGLVTREELEELHDRLTALEEALVGGGEEPAKKARKAKKSSDD